MLIFTRAFWTYAGERAIKTFAQTGLSLLGVGAVSGLLSIAWVPLLSALGLAVVLSVLTSINSYNPTTVTVEITPASVEVTSPAAPE